MSIVNVDIIDKSVPPERRVNIAIINQPNPVTNYPVNGDQMLQLIQFPQYWITDTATGVVINGGNIYDFYPDLRPGGGGGGGGGGTAADIEYDNTTTGMAATNVQQAIDETYTDIENKLDKAPNGTTNLIDSSGVVDPSYLPDYLLGTCIYAGNVTTNAVATLTTAAQHKLDTDLQAIALTNDTTPVTGYAANEGMYYIATADFTFADIELKTGDWLISLGTKWSKVDNTDAVTGVKGDAESTYRIGNVNITKGNIGLGNVDNTSDLDKPISTATQEALNLKFDTADIDDEFSETSENPVQNKVITNTIGDVEAVLEGVLSRSFVPTEEQLEAMNSGITAADVEQIETNKNDILSEQAKTTGMSEGGSNYITVGGIRVYVSATTPTGTIPDGSLGFGF